MDQDFANTTDVEEGWPDALATHYPRDVEHRRNSAGQMWTVFTGKWSVVMKSSESYDY